MSSVYFNTTEAYKAWAEAQGGSPVKDAVGRLLFPSGARCDAAGYCGTPPPADPRQRLKRRREYHLVRRDRVRTDLRHLEASLAGHANPFKWPEREYGPGPANPDEAVALLRRVLAERERALAALDAEVANTPARGGY